MSDSIITSSLPLNNTIKIQINGTNERRYEINCDVNNICVIRCLSSQACTNLALYCPGVCYVECDVNGGEIDCPVNLGYTYTYSADNQSTIAGDAYGGSGSDNNNNKRVWKATVSIAIAVCATVVILACICCMAFLNVYNLKNAISDGYQVSISVGTKSLSKARSDSDNDNDNEKNNDKKKQKGPLGISKKVKDFNGDVQQAMAIHLAQEISSRNEKKKGLPKINYNDHEKKDDSDFNAEQGSPEIVYQSVSKVDHGIMMKINQLNRNVKKDMNPNDIDNESLYGEGPANAVVYMSSTPGSPRSPRSPKSARSTQ